MLVIKHQYNIIQMNDNSLDFTIYNKSGYTQPYQYQFYDMIEGGPGMFNYEEGDFTLGPDQSMDLSFLIENSNLESTAISLSIWPTYHD